VLKKAHESLLELNNDSVNFLANTHKKHSCGLKTLVGETLLIFFQQLFMSY